MVDIIQDALADTAEMVPWLIAIYVFIGFLEYRFGDRLGRFVEKLGAWGPLVGALVGCLPQCGFSIVASALYVKRLVSVGTLMAVYLSTSDEAIPVLLSMPQQAPVVGSLIVIKLVAACTVGFLIDFFIHKRAAKKSLAIEAVSQQIVEEHHGCCDHGVTKKSSALKVLLIHPLWHTIKIVAFIFALTAILDFAIHQIGPYRLKEIFSSGTMLQPLLAALTGSIPNCFPSVFLVQLFSKDILSFGSLVAGLCCSSGLGPLVLFKENKDKRETFCIIAAHICISVLLGMIIQFASPWK